MQLPKVLSELQKLNIIESTEKRKKEYVGYTLRWMEATKGSLSYKHQDSAIQFYHTVNDGEEKK
jgi:hypothetical protein